MNQYVWVQSPNGGTKMVVDRALADELIRRGWKEISDPHAQSAASVSTDDSEGGA